MSIPTFKGVSRYIRVTPTTGADVPPAGTSLIEFGPAGTTQQVSTMVLQFNPSSDFTGGFVVMARGMGSAADAANMPFVPIKYKPWSVNDVATDPLYIADQITTSALIDVAANGKSIGVEFVCTTGYMDITIWDLQGPSSTA